MRRTTRPNDGPRKLTTDTDRRVVGFDRYPLRPGATGSAETERLASKAVPRLGCSLLVVLLLLAAPVASAALFWGSWGWVAAAVAVAGVEFAALQRSQQFSARVWRSVRVGRRSRRERATESLYVVTAIAGVILLAVAVVSTV